MRKVARSLFDNIHKKITCLALLESFGYQQIAALNWFLYISIVYQPITVFHSLRNLHYIPFFLHYFSSLFVMCFQFTKNWTALSQSDSRNVFMYVIKYKYIVIISSLVVYNEWTRAFRQHSDFHSAKNHSLSNQSLGSSRRNALHKLWTLSRNLLRWKRCIQRGHVYLE